jgi:hypothetical protein
MPWSSMHNAIRMAQATQRTLFERFRSGRLLRVVSTIIALVAFQNSFACLCDDPPRAANGGIATTQSAIPLDVGVGSESPEDGCCAFCSSCAACGCCSAAAGPRVTADSLGSRAAADLKISLATSAEVIWTPPTLLRPPIRIV